MSAGEEEDWKFGDEDNDEYAYADYAESGKKKRKHEGDEGARSATEASAVEREGEEQPRSMLERAAPWIPDAFRGYHCPICLESIQQSAMIEPCRHLYCKSCLFEWLAISDRCPLCKVIVSRVLHDIKSPKEYEVHLHVRRDSRGGGSSSPSSSPSAAAAGITLADVSFSHAERQGPGSAGGSGSGSGGIRGVEFRSVVYRRGLAAEPPEPKARRPKSTAQLRPWIAREVQAAANGLARAGGGAPDMRLVADVVEALLKEHDVDDQEGYCKVKEQLQDFLFENTGPFLHELWCFRWSKLGLAAHDRDTVYASRSRGS